MKKGKRKGTGTIFSQGQPSILMTVLFYPPQADGVSIYK
jgi:hypothetical protein